jgi:hypothetical protein
MDGQRPRPARRLTIVDLAVLVAAVAVALPVLRHHLWEEWAYPNWLVGPPRWEEWAYSSRLGRTGRGNLPARILPWILRALPLLAAVAPALLFLRFLSPRPPWRRVFRQPGTVACLAATASGTPAMVHCVAVVTRPSGVANPVTYCLIGLEPIGGAVLIAWLTLTLVGAWRPAPDWIDRAGRALGVILIAIYVAAVARPIMLF